MGFVNRLRSFSVWSGMGVASTPVPSCVELHSKITRGPGSRLLVLPVHLLCRTQSTGGACFSPCPVNDGQRWCQPDVGGTVGFSPSLDAGCPCGWGGSCVGIWALAPTQVLLTVSDVSSCFSPRLPKKCHQVSCASCL